MTGPARQLELRLLAVLLPQAERDEVVGELAAEQAARRATDGRLRARLWLWRQVLGSVPALLRRSWWRGWSGFEPEANRMRTGGPMVESWIMDARFAGRRLLRRPTYTTLAVVTLALGVGGTAAIYGIARELLLSPLPVAAEEELVVWWKARNWSEAEHVYLREVGVPGFERTALWGVEDVRLAAAGGTRVVPAVRTSAELFDVLGVRPSLGAGFAVGDDVPGAEPKAVLSHGLWQELGGSPDVIGSRIELNGVLRTVAGVMPAGFWFPDPTVRVWLAHGFNPVGRSGWYTVLGRLSSGQGAGDVQGALASISSLLAERFEYAPAWDNSQDAELVSLREFVLGPVRPTLVATFAAMAVILLIACANVAALMLGQTAARSTELSVRSALGAGRTRLTQQLVLEGVALGVAAGLAGAAFAAASFRLLLAGLPLGALAERAALDWQVFGFAMVIAVTAALAVALVPVFALVRADLRGPLSHARSGGIAGRGGRLESGLVVGEVALAVVIAAGAALLIRSVENLRAIDTGLDVSDVAILDVVAPAELPAADRSRLLRELVAELGTVPGVTHAAAVQRLPLRGGGDNWGLTIEGRPDVQGVTTSFRIVTHDWLAVAGGRLRSGRWFDAGDRADTEPVIVINEALAREFFGAEDPLGRRIELFDDHARIIGVIGNIREAGLTDDFAPARYVLYDQIPYAPNANTLALRVRDGAAAPPVLDAARTRIHSVAPGVGIQEATTLARVFERALGPVRQLMTLLTLLSALALLLGGIGVYGVVSHFVQRRRRDWGIRMALGQRPAQVLGLVVARGAALVAAGVALGVAGALLLARVLAAFVYGIGTTDPIALAAAAAVLFGSGVFGAFVPARRASRVDPARVLRE